MMVTKDVVPYRSDNYVGVSMLDTNPYAARLIQDSLSKPKNESHFFFDEVTSYYNQAENALTIEGYAKSPDFAVRVLMDYAKIAREASNLPKPFTS